MDFLGRKLAAVRWFPDYSALRTARGRMPRTIGCQIALRRVSAQRCNRLLSVVSVISLVSRLLEARLLLEPPSNFPTQMEGFVMKKLGAMLVVASLGAILALHGHASAALPCPAGCGGQKNACVQTARVAKSTCKQDCHTSSDPTARGTCMRACSVTFRSAKTSCQADHVSCIGACNPPSPPGHPNSCLGTCGTDLATCAQGVTAQLKTCVTGCRSASDHLACLQACGAAAKQGAATCASDFQTCRANCPSSPSAAFVE